MGVRIGVPRETATGETRIAIVPAVAEKYVALGAEVLVQRSAGQLSHIRDEEFTAATLVDTEAEVFAADVVLKERRRLVLMVRETPLHLGHLRTMTALAEMGAVIAPPVPALYSRPQSIDEMVDHTVGRVLDLFGLDSGRVRRWGEPHSISR